MYIPTLWDRWERDGQILYSAALITDEPAPEIKSTGHDRTPIFLKESAVDSWLLAEGSTTTFKELLFQRELPYYGHRVLRAV